MLLTVPKRKRHHTALQYIKSQDFVSQNTRVYQISGVWSIALNKVWAGRNEQERKSKLLGARLGSFESFMQTSGCKICLQKLMPLPQKEQRDLVLEYKGLTQRSAERIIQGLGWFVCIGKAYI